MKLNLHCKNPECGYKWDYSGEALWYVSCPRCRSNIRIREEYKKHFDEVYGVSDT